MKDKDKLIIAIAPFAFIGLMLFFLLAPILCVVSIFAGFLYFLIRWW